MRELGEVGTDHGLFGPGSVTWRVMGEPVLLVGGIRALLLQALHPRSVWGTAQNSELMDPAAAWARLTRTVEF
ncbi:MAG TPA: oxygenase MpaB family protein, partial [Spirillospora sp.]|nr:oxygenase MpaB family protein [Spirillospora sp.]